MDRIRSSRTGRLRPDLLGYNCCRKASGTVVAMWASDRCRRRRFGSTGWSPSSDCYCIGAATFVDWMLACRCGVEIAGFLGGRLR